MSWPRQGRFFSELFEVGMGKFTGVKPEQAIIALLEDQWARTTGVILSTAPRTMYPLKDNLRAFPGKR